MIDKNRLVDEFLELVKIDSTSLCERYMADAITNKLNLMGYDVYEDSTARKIGGNAGNLICKIKGNENVPAIVFMAHMDTVTPGENKKPWIDKDVIRTDGTTILGADDLSGISCILESLRVIKENNIKHGDIYVIFTVAEEIGLLGAKNLNYKDIKAKYCFVLDSTGDVGGVAVKAPYHNSIKIVIKGKAAHAGIEPENGISSIEMAAEAISSNKFGRIDEDTTTNIGIIRGGSATNIVCDNVEIQAEVRSIHESKLEEQTQKIKKSFTDAACKFGGKVKFNIQREYSGFDINSNHAIINILRKAFTNMELELRLLSIGGGSDTNITNEQGMVSVNLSIAMRQVHTTCEHIAINDMLKVTELIIEIIKSVSDEVD